MNKIENKEWQKIRIDLGNSVTLSNCNIHIIGVPEEDNKEKGAQSLSEEIIAENYPNLRRKTNIQNQEAERTPQQNQEKQIHTKTCYN